MNDLISYQFDQEPVRVVMIGDAPWWVANDIAKVLGYRMASDMTRNLDDDERGTHIVRTPSGDQEMNVISESGLFKSILKSRKPEAKRFTKWVTSEVLPSIRRTGRYELFDTPPQLPSPALQDAELSRLTAAIGIAREARMIWGREDCRLIWMQIGLPSPIAASIGGENDEFATQVDCVTRSAEAVTTADVAHGLGVVIDARMSMRIGATLRLLGWAVKKERVEGVPRNVWRRLDRPTYAAGGEA